MPERTFKITDLANPEWFKDTKQGSIWITCCRTFRISEEAIPEGIKTLDFRDLKVVFLSGSVKYYDSNKLKIQFETETKWRVDASDYKEQDTPRGIYTLFVAPFDKGFTHGNEAETRAKISSYLGFVAAFQGRNNSQHRLFESIFLFPEDKVSNFSPVVENPFLFPTPSLSETALNLIHSANQNLLLFEESKRNRTLLSLRWFEQALFDSGIDAFLKFWIAVETIAMPDTDIRPLNESLAKAYGETIQNIQDRFRIGRLFGLRSKIVHEGLIAPIHFHLLKYAEALYADSLCEFLGISSQRRLEQMVNTPEFDLMTMLSK